MHVDVQPLGGVSSTQSRGRKKIVYSSVSRRRERSRRSGGLRALTAAVLCGSLIALAPASASADNMATEGGLGVGSVVTSLVYGPVKLIYAIGGCIVGGLAWVFSGGDSDVAKVVLTPSVRGDYVITPNQLRGRERIHFLGRDPEYRREEAEVAQVPEGW